VRCIRLVFVVCLLLPGLVATAAFAKTVRVSMIPPADAPTIDGALDESVWQRAGVADGFLLEGTADSPSQPTTVRFLCDGTQLYVGVRCAEVDLARMKVDATPEKGGVWADDFVEIHIDVTNTKQRFEQFAVNPAGVKTDDAICSNARIATARGENEWRIEMALALDDLGVRHLAAPVRWALNIGRVRYNSRPGEETSVWNGAPATVDDPAAMGEMIVGPDGHLIVNRLEIGDARWGAGNPVTFRVTNTWQPREVSVRAKPISASRDEREERVDSAVPYGQDRQVPGLFTINSLNPDQRIGISLADSEGALLYRLWRPVEIRPLLSLEPLQPRYRGLIFPDVEQCRFLAELGLTDAALAGVTLEMQISAAPWSAPTRTVSRLASETEAAPAAEKAPELPRDREITFGSFTPRTQASLLSVPTRTLPYGDLGIRVRCVALDGRRLAEVSMPLRRLTEKEAAAVPSYVDEHNRLIVNGYPFFPLGWYGARNIRHLEEIANSPFNCILDYGINGMPLNEIRTYLDTAQTCGVKLIYCMNDLYPAATYHKQIGPWTGNADMARGVISTFKDHPAVIAWYLNDELPREMIPDLMRYYDLVRSTDPNHPTFIVHFVRDIIADYVPTTDILGIDVYPVPSRGVMPVSDMTDVGIAATQGLKPLWMVLQAFAWYQYGDPEDPDATGGRGRTPTENELRAGRAPTRDEERCMTYLALTHGAMGLIYYSYYDMHVLPQYEEMWGWMKEIGAEVKTLSPALLSPVKRPVEVRGDSRQIHALLKEYEGKWYLLAVNGEYTPAAAEFVLPGAAESVKVLFEEHTPTLTGAVLADDFAPLAAHVYEITPAAAKQ
jgi:hypothetical protein